MRQNKNVESGIKQMNRVGARLGARLGARTRTPNTRSTKSCTDMWVLSRAPTKMQRVGVRLGAKNTGNEALHRLGAPHRRTEILVPSRAPSDERSQCPTQRQKQGCPVSYTHLTLPTIYSV